MKSSSKALLLGQAALRKRQSPRTGFVHFFPGTEGIADTIPVYENFCFVLALFRSKTSAEVLEGKELLERLLDFQTAEGNFPVYLHAYPQCWDRLLALKLAPAFSLLKKRFAPFLGEALFLRLQESERRLFAYAVTAREKKPFLPLWEERFQAWQGRAPSLPYKSAEEWAEGILSHQLAGAPLKRFPPLGFQAFLGDHLEQEGKEPKPALIEWLFVEEEEPFSPRLARDHALQMALPLFWPLEFWPLEEKRAGEKGDFWRAAEEGAARLLWRGEHLHSLIAEGPLGKWGQTADGLEGSFLLGEEPSLGREDLVEAAFYVDLSSETEIFIRGKKATAFSLDDPVTIQTKDLKLTICFTMQSGEAAFMGSISRKNRAGQCLAGVYDWRIALRTLRRQGVCQIGWRICVAQSEELREAEPEKNALALLGASP